MREYKWEMIWKGFIVGGTMLVPGVSGGTMAMILGIYDQLISAMASLQKDFRKHLRILFLFIIGAGIGMFFLSAPISWLLSHYEIPTIYFFIGAVFGGIPMIQKKCGEWRASKDVIFYMASGMVCVLAISAVPENLLSINGEWMVLVIIGAVGAAALILPGISISHFFLVLGLYENVVGAIRAADMNILIPLGIGLLLGMLLFTRILEKAMSRKPRQTYLLILGFILGSVAGIFPGVPKGGSFMACIGLAGLGFFSVYYISKKELATCR